MNDSQDLRSPGQNQVWNLARAVLAEFPVNPTTTKGAEESDGIGYHVYKTFLSRLKKDRVVRQDLYTGRRIVKKEVATSYVEWLTKNATARVAPVAAGDPIAVDFNRIAFYGSAIGSGMSEPLAVRQRVYEGGSSRPTGSTARAVLTLVKGDDLPTDGLDMTYLSRSRVLCVTGGNHRAIAYKLLGLRNFPLEKVKICDDCPNEALNQALLCLESLYTPRDPRGTSISIRTPADADRAIALGKAYGAYSRGTRPSALFLFTKWDLFDPESPRTAGLNTSALDLLSLYTNVCQPLPSPRPRAWLQRLFQRDIKTAQTALPYEEVEMRARWVKWCATHSS